MWIKEQKNVQKLLNYLAAYNFIEEVNECFTLLVQKGYIFDSREYI